MTNTEDDFWNESSSSRLNFFDDDDDTPTEAEAFSPNVQENVTLPIHSIISNKCLKIILDDTDSIVEHVVSPPDETIKRMFFGENFVLNTYQSLESKLELLDAALDICDGNIIITVILFLSKTLNNNIFFTQLSKRKIAIRHYTNFLIEKNNLQELADLFMATGNIFNLKDIYCLLCKDISNNKVLQKRIEQFNILHAQNLTHDDKSEIQENLSFLDFQIKLNFTSHSLIEQLIFLCKSEWEKGSGDEVVNNFKKQFKIDDFQFEWVVMCVLCKMQRWDKLVAVFLKSMWMLKKRALKSVIRPELFVVGIAHHNPPEHITEQFLSCIGDGPKALHLAEKFKIHSYVISFYVEQKDKLALLKYMEHVEPGSPAMYMIQSNLNSSDIRWKN